MSLLREGGQWDEDDDLRAGYTGEREGAPFARTTSWGGTTARDRGYGNAKEQGKSQGEGGPSMPFAVSDS